MQGGYIAETNLKALCPVLVIPDGMVMLGNKKVPIVRWTFCFRSRPVHIPSLFLFRFLLVKENNSQMRRIEAIMKKQLLQIQVHLCTKQGKWALPA